jgi:transposase-like protein
MPWKGVTVSEQRQRFLEDYQLNYYSMTELAERFSVSRKTAYKWITRYKELGQSGSASQGRPPTSELPDIRSSVRAAFMSAPAGRAAVLGRRMRRSWRRWWSCGSDIPAGVRASCWISWFGGTHVESFLRFQPGPGSWPEKG